MLKLDYQNGENKFSLSMDFPVLEVLKKLPDWKLPRENKNDTSLLHSLDSIYKKSLPLIQEFQNAAIARKSELEKELAANSALSLEKAHELSVPGKFSIVRSVRIDFWKIKVAVNYNKNLEGVISNDVSDYNITVLELDNKKNVGHAPKPPMISKGALERDHNKSRVVAGTRKIEAFAKAFNQKNFQGRR